MSAASRHCSVCGRPCAGHPGRYGPTCVLPHISTNPSTSADSGGNSSDAYYTPSGTQQDTQFQFTTSAVTTTSTVSGQVGPSNVNGENEVSTSTSTEGSMSTSTVSAMQGSCVSAASNVSPGGTLPPIPSTRSIPVTQVGTGLGTNAVAGVAGVSGVMGVNSNYQVPSFWTGAQGGAPGPCPPPLWWATISYLNQGRTRLVWLVLLVP